MSQYDLSRPGAVGSIAVLRALPGLGDLLCAVPALRALRAAQPDAHVVFVGLRRAAWFGDRFAHLVDEFVPVAAYPPLPETPGTAAEAVAFLTSMQERRFELAIQLHGSGLASNPLLVLLGAAANAGTYLPGQFCPDPATFVPYPGRGHEVDRLLAVVTALGVEPRGTHLEWPFARDEEGPCELVAGALAPGEPYVVVHAGSSVPERRWPARCFATVADALAARGLRVVLTGNDAERAVAAEVAGAMAHPSIDLSGRTDLGALARLVRDARLVVCNDTGVSHLASATATPSVVVFTASDPARWAPRPPERHAAVLRADLVPPRPRCGHGGEACLLDGCVAATVRRDPAPEALLDAVLAAVDDALRAGRSRPAGPLSVS